MPSFSLNREDSFWALIYTLFFRVASAFVQTPTQTPSTRQLFLTVKMTKAINYFWIWSVRINHSVVSVSNEIITFVRRWSHKRLSWWIWMLMTRCSRPVIFISSYHFMSLNREIDSESNIDILSYDMCSSIHELASQLPYSSTMWNEHHSININEHSDLSQS